jgi:hypothetical protein
VTQFTADTPDYDEAYYYPNLARLNGNRVLFTWYRYSDDYIYYAVLDSAGETVKDKTSTGGYGWRPDAVQLSDGKVVIAWDEDIEFVVLDGDTYSKVAGPIWLYNPASPTGDAYVSVAADNAGHAILTWMDSDWDVRHNLYYALVDGDGSTLTGPMIFQTTQATGSHIETSFEGYGNTSFTDSTPPASQASSPEFAFEAFQVAWRGSDAGFGIASYDVQVRDGASGTWETWLSNTTATSATYSAVAVGHTYYFRSAAQDWAGHVETDLPADGDTHTTIAAYQVTGQVVNNRHQPVFDATVAAQPVGLNTATTDGAGDYILYLGSSGVYSLTASHEDFGDLPPRYGVLVDGDLSSVDFVLPPLDDALINGGWETGDLGGWSPGPGVTPTVEMSATHTGHYGLDLEMSGGTLVFWPYVTQPASIPATWSQPTLSFLYRVVQSSPGNELLATVSATGDSLTHTLPLTPGEWTHTWLDLSALSGQTVTLSLGFRGQPGTQQMAQQVYVDELSLGAFRPGVYSTYLPLVLRSD